MKDDRMDSTETLVILSVNKITSIYDVIIRWLSKWEYVEQEELNSHSDY